MRNNEDLLELFDRISNGVASDEDISEYNRWCNGFQTKGSAVADIEEIKAAMLTEIERRIHYRYGSHRLRLWYKIGAAAAVILLLAIGGYHFMNRQEPEQIVQSRPPDIAPGGNKAVLTLASGKTIILDSAHNGQLTRQGNSRVTKLDSGLLVYQSRRLKGENLGQKDQGPVTFNTLTIPRGGQYRLILPDGTKVWLNSASSIRYPTAFRGKGRQVSITGEVYMEVAKDPSRPFIVRTRHSDITVLGTRFNIMAYDNEPAVATTLVAGSVKVSVLGEQREAIITPGQQARVGNKSPNIKVKEVNATDVAAWIHGLLSLKDCSLQEFMNQLSRWYNVDIKYTGKVPQQRFGGMINRNAPLSDVLAALDAGGIHTKLEEKKIIVLSP